MEKQVSLSGLKLQVIDRGVLRNSTGRTERDPCYGKVETSIDAEMV